MLPLSDPHQLEAFIERLRDNGWTAVPLAFGSLARLHCRGAMHIASVRLRLARSPTPFPMPFGTKIWLRQYCFMLCGLRARRALLLSVRVRDGLPQDGTREQVPGPRDLPAAVLVADRHHRLALAGDTHKNGCVHRCRPNRAPPLLT